jgi:hypothetical protein
MVESHGGADNYYHFEDGEANSIVLSAGHSNGNGWGYGYGSGSGNIEGSDEAHWYVDTSNGSGDERGGGGDKTKFGDFN